MNYAIYIKSHTSAPDYEQEVEAENEDEAIKKFYEMLHGEFDKEFIKQNMAQA